MKFSKKIKVAALVVASLFMTGCGTQVNIGYVDGERIMNESPQIQKVIEENQNKADELQKEAAATIENNPDWTDEEKNNALVEIQRKLFGLNQSSSMQVKQKFDEAIAGIATEKKLDVVVDSSENQPIILMGGIDVTDEVIKKLQ